MEIIFGKHWHHLPADEVESLLDSDVEKGLDVFRVNRRMERFGANVLTRRKGKGPLVLFLLQFHQALIYILLGAALITGYSGSGWTQG